MSWTGLPMGRRAPSPSPYPWRVGYHPSNRSRASVSEETPPILVAVCRLGLRGRPSECEAIHYYRMSCRILWNCKLSKVQPH
jgi:hypothetical protein